MLVEARRQQLLELISRRGFARLEDLVESSGVSESTVRRDLEALDQNGAIKRTHGGAMYVGELRSMPAFDDRTTTAANEKRAIGRATAELIGDGETVLLDGGTTTLEVARALLGRRLQVVTNSLPIAQLLAPHKETDLILIGGYVYPRTGVALGPIAIACMQEIRVTTVVMGAGGIVADGIYNSNSLLVETEQAMMLRGQTVVIVADHTKFGRTALKRLCAVSDVGRVVVDAGISDEYRQLVESTGVALTVAALDEPTRKNGTEGRPRA